MCMRGNWLCHPCVRDISDNTMQQVMERNEALRRMTQQERLQEARDNKSAALEAASQARSAALETASAAWRTFQPSLEEELGQHDFSPNHFRQLLCTWHPAKNGDSELSKLAFSWLQSRTCGCLTRSTIPIQSAEPWNQGFYEKVKAIRVSRANYYDLDGWHARADVSNVPNKHRVRAWLNNRGVNFRPSLRGSVSIGAVGESATLADAEPLGAWLCGSLETPQVLTPPCGRRDMIRTAWHGGHAWSVRDVVKWGMRAGWQGSTPGAYTAPTDDVRQALGYMWHVPVTEDGWYWGVLYQLEVCTCSSCWTTFRSGGTGTLQWINKGQLGALVTSVAVTRVWLHGMSYLTLHPSAKSSSHSLCGGNIVCKRFDPAVEAQT